MQLGCFAAGQGKNGAGRFDPNERASGLKSPGYIVTKNGILEALAESRILIGNL
jgi:hypothetical protein